MFTGTCRYTGLPVRLVYRFFLVLPLQAGKSGHRLYYNCTDKKNVQRLGLQKKCTGMCRKLKKVGPVDDWYGTWWLVQVSIEIRTMAMRA